MDHPGDSPDSHATRRRVWRFVFGSLFVVAVVAFWPLKGYRIDKDRFASSLGPPYVGGAYHDRSPMDPPDDGRAVCKIWDLWTPIACGNFFEQQLRNARFWAASRKYFGYDWKQLDGIDSNVFAWIVTERGNSKVWSVGFVWHYRNVVVNATIVFGDRPLGKSPEHVVRDTLNVITDGIERKIPGVTTFYNPPARQLWHDRVRPFFRKGFPKLLPPPSRFISSPTP